MIEALMVTVVLLAFVAGLGLGTVIGMTKAVEDGWSTR